MYFSGTRKTEAVGGYQVMMRNLSNINANCATEILYAAKVWALLRLVYKLPNLNMPVFSGRHTGTLFIFMFY